MEGSTYEELLSPPYKKIMIIIIKIIWILYPGPGVIHKLFTNSFTYLLPIYLIIYLSNYLILDELLCGTNKTHS